MKRNFTQIENILIKDNRITDSEFRTYLVLRSYRFGVNGKVYPTQEVIASDRGKSPRIIIEHLKSLALKGYIKYARIGYNQPNLYKFAGEEFFTSEMKPTSLPSRRKLHSNNTELNNTNKNTLVNSQVIEEIRNKHPFLRRK